MIKSLKVVVNPLEKEKKELGLIWSQLKKQLISMEREEKLSKILKIVYTNEKIKKKDHNNGLGNKVELVNSYLMRLNIEYLDELEFFYQNLTEPMSEEEHNNIYRIIKKINLKYKNKKKYKGETAKLFLEKLKKFKIEEVYKSYENSKREYQFDEASDFSLKPFNEIIVKIEREISEIFENQLPDIDIEFQKKYKNNLFLFYGYYADFCYKKGVFDYKNKKIYYPYEEITFTENNILFLKKKKNSQEKEVMFYDDKIRLIGKIEDTGDNNNEKVYKINNNYYVFIDKKIFKIKKEEIENFKNLENKKYKILDLGITQRIVDVYPICQGDHRVKSLFTKKNKDKNKKILIDSNLNIITEINSTYKIKSLDVYDGTEKITSDLEYIIGNLGDYTFLKKDKEVKWDLNTNKATIYIQIIGDRRKLSFPQIIVEEKQILEYKKINEIKLQKDEKKIIIKLIYKVVEGIEKGKEVDIEQKIYFEI